MTVSAALPPPTHTPPLLQVEAHELVLPEGQGAQLSLLLSKASLQLQLGQREAFASSLLPQFTRLFEQAETNAAVVAAAKKVPAARGRGGKCVRWGGGAV